MVLNVLPTDSSPDSGGDSCSSGEPCGSGMEKIYPTTAIRYGYMRHIGEFTRPGNMKFSCGAKVVVQTKRGIEVGEQVSLACGGCDRSVSREQIQAYVRRSGPDHFELSSGRVLRLASEQDLADLDHINMDCATKQRFCQELTERHKLEMKVVTCEHLFGGERIIFYFMAQGRVDFRNLVKDLAQEYQTRIELRQVGARDEARLVADYETCGRECCCRSFLKTLKPVTMKMAKLQKATLDPSKVSGRCGRLKCCLRYEHTSYEELDRTLPRIGKLVRTREGEGRVVGRQILTQLLQIQTAAGTRFGAAVEDLLGPDEPRVTEAPAPKMPETPAPSRQGDTQPAADQGAAAGKGKRRRRRRAKGPRPADGVAPGPTPPPQPGPTGTVQGESVKPGPTDAPETQAGSAPASAEQTPTDQAGGSAENTPNRRRGGRRRSRSRRGGGRDGPAGGGSVSSESGGGEPQSGDQGARNETDTSPPVNDD